MSVEEEFGRELGLSIGDEVSFNVAGEPVSDAEIILLANHPFEDTLWPVGFDRHADAGSFF